MGKRKIKNADFNHFSDDGGRNREDASYEETNAAFFGQFADIQAIKQLRIEQIDIFDIVPDLRQPRRTLPSVLRRGRRVKPDNMSIIFEKWLNIANEERKRNDYPPLNLREAIEMVETALPSPIAEHTRTYEDEHRLPRMWITEHGIRIDPRDIKNVDSIDDGLRPEWIEAPDSLELKKQLSKFSAEAALMHIIVLAASIKQDGLTNPITLVRRKNEYTIETGERRWMSYHLLHMIYGDNWRTIPSRIVPEYSVWRQASENNARQELNAISKARQLALLIMDMYDKTDTEFLPIEEFEHEQDYYAQVADGVKWRVLKGETQKLLTFLGLSDPAQIRQYRALLRIDRDLWDFADDNNISEFEIREMVRSGFTPFKSDTRSELSEKLASLVKEASIESEEDTFSMEWYKIANRQRALAKKLSPDNRRKMVILLRSLADEIERFQ